MILPDNLIPSPGRTYTVPADTAPDTCGSVSTWDALRIRGIIPSSSGSSCQCEADHFEKSSADVLDYAVEFADWPGDGGDSIVSVSVSFPDSTGNAYDLVALWAKLADDTTAVFMLASGERRKKYSVVVTVVTEQGRTKTATIYVTITRDTPDTLPPTEPALVNAVTQGGVQVTIHNSPVTLST